MAIKRLTLYQNNSQIINVDGLQDQAQLPSVAYINDAVLLATLQDANGVSQDGATAMPGLYQSASNGNYVFAVDGAVFDPVVGYDYVFVIDGTFDAGAKRYHAEIPTNVLIRNQGTET